MTHICHPAEKSEIGRWIRANLQMSRSFRMLSPLFCCFREELRPRNTKKKISPHGMASCVCTSFFPWKLIWGTRGFTWELLFLQIFLTFLNQRWTTSTDLSQTTLQLLHKRKQKIKKKRRQKLNIKHFLNVLKAWLSLDHGLRPVLE